ncbi:unnamed protein product [Arctia plantaginis]|uniref:Uncharacterized protein n=1 Tax=Arctia plantaginis TaxID=874455 RepID=A0A8S0YVJ3_ARCPL|nr:unnamed protein product [Arctia plantaginis]
MPQHACKKFNRKQYWNAELSKAVAERRLALANLRRSLSPVNLDILQQKIRYSQRLIRMAKSLGWSWQEFYTSVDETTSSSEMWKKMRWVKVHRSNSHNYYKDNDSALSLLNSLTSDHACPSQPRFHSVYSTLESEITIHESDNSIKKTDTAPGKDEI